MAEPAVGPGVSGGPGVKPLSRTRKPQQRISAITCSTGNAKRNFTSEVPGTRLVGDITYLRTGEGWLYLATVIDVCTGMVIGWSMADHMRASLCTAALTMARDHGYLADDNSGDERVFHFRPG